jgi:hypothetical protein
MKSEADYMNDPRITGDPAMMNALLRIRELHAIRLKLQDESAGMTEDEYCNFYHNEATAFFAASDIVPKYAALPAGKQ